MEASGYFPLAGCGVTPEVEELAAIARRKHALDLQIEDTMRQLRAVVDPPLPPILEGEHVLGASMRHAVGAIIGLVLACLPS